MGRRSSRDRLPPSAYDSDRLLTPRVLMFTAACVLIGFLAVLYAVLRLLENGVDPAPLLAAFGPVSLADVALGLLNGVLLLMLKPQFGRIERNTGENSRLLKETVAPAPAAPPTPGPLAPPEPLPEAHGASEIGRAHV